MFTSLKKRYRENVFADMFYMYIFIIKLTYKREIIGFCQLFRAYFLRSSVKMYTFAYCIHISS